MGVIDKRDQRFWIKEVKDVCVVGVNSDAVKGYRDYMTNMSAPKEEYDLTEAYEYNTIYDLRARRYCLEKELDGIDLQLHRLMEEMEYTDW